jgi:hypothetical protein
LTSTYVNTYDEKQRQLEMDMEMEMEEVAGGG